MGKKKPKQEVVAYGMSIHFGICAGPVEYISNLIVDEKPAWPEDWPKHPQRLIGLTQIGLFLIDLFGGEKKEGGLAGLVSWLPGAADQVMPENLAEKFGRTSATMPAYRGIASIFFSGPAGVLPGFLWRYNTPFLPGVWVEVARASEALEIPHARIWRSRMRRSVHIAIDESPHMAGTDGVRGATMKAAVGTVLDAISDFIAIGVLDIDLQITTYGFIESVRYFFHATTADIATLKSYVNGLPFSASDTNFDWVQFYANSWFNSGASDTSIQKRILVMLSAAPPTHLGGSETPDELAAAAAAGMSDILSRDGGTFNTAAGTAVDCYGINVDLADTHYTAQLDNTPGDGVPVVSGSDPTGLVNAIFRALELDSVYDSNPAHIIYESLTNPNWGMGAPASAIDVTGFIAVSDTLYNENFGLSMMWVQQSSIEDFISEVLDHIQATLFVNPHNGLLTLKLIRNDYSVPALPVFTPDNSVVTNFSRKLWGETINEIVVTWTNPENEEEETVVAQDLANIEAQGGVISDSRNYYGVRRSDLAARLAHRDLRSASTPLAKCDLEVNRTAWDLLPGDCCVLDSPEDGIDAIVMRVGPVDYGKPGDSTVRTSLVEDVFSLALADYSEPPESLWVDTSENPSAADHTKIVTLAYYLVVNLIDPTVVAGVDYPEVFAGVLASEGGHDTQTFELLGQETNAAGVLVYANFGTKSITSRATLAAAIAAEAETTILSFPGRTQGNGPVVGGLMLIEGAGETTSEICLVSAVGTGGYTMKRGVLDTIPRAWPIGTPVWFVDDNMEFVDDTIRSAAETVNFKVLPTTSRGTLAASAASVSSGVMTARPHLPLRPADVKVNGDDGFSGTVDITGVDPIPVTWARRNRETETAIIKAWKDGDVTPETGQTTIIEVLNPAGTVVVTTHAGLAGTSYNVPAASFGGNTSGWIRVGAERDGHRELQGYAIKCVIPTSISVAVAGLAATASVGAVTVVAATSVSVAVTGLSLTTSVGSVIVTTVTPDPNFSDVVLLVGANDIDGSTTFIDESPFAHALTANGNAQIDTAQAKFGASSALFDGTGDYVSTPDSVHWSIGPSQFTIEAWVMFSSLKNACILSQDASSQGNFYFYWTPNNLSCSLDTGGGSAGSTYSGAWLPVINTWYHVALDRDAANKVRLYVNGAMVGSGTHTAALFDSNATLCIGRLPINTGWDFPGWIDELRFTNGTARYASDSGYTVPTSAFPRSGAASPSYWNPGGVGDRTASITVTTTATAGAGTVNQIVNGSKTQQFWWVNGQSGCEIKFDFGTARRITDVKWHQSFAAAHGTWKWQGSSDGSSWTDIGGTFALGTAAQQGITTMSANPNFWRYYRMLQTAGTTSSSGYELEIEFKIMA